MEFREDAPRIWLIAGPTASGKSALALRLARAIGGDIVNADSMQLYRDLAVLSARPPREETLLAPHHLFGVADAAEGWSVGRWLDAARAELDDIALWRRPAIVVGGTGLYFRALTHGLAEIPAVPRDLTDRLAATGEMMLRERLAKADHEAELRIARGDIQRLSRALAVAQHTGRPLTAWQADTLPTLAPDAWRAVVLEPDRDALYARCDARLEAMVAAGALDEVAALMARGLEPALPAMKAVGVREFTAHLAGRTSLLKALAAAQQETRRFAKRQSTWFRNQTPGWPRVTALDPEDQWRQFLALNPSLTAPA